MFIAFCNVLEQSKTLAITGSTFASVMLWIVLIWNSAIDQSPHYYGYFLNSILIEATIKMPIQPCYQNIHYVIYCYNQNMILSLNETIYVLENYYLDRNTWQIASI